MDLGLRRAGRRLLEEAMGVAALRQLAGLTSRAGLLPQTIRCRLPLVEETAFRVRASRGGFRYRFVPGDLIGRELFWKGLAGWEPETITVFCALARESRHVLDIGANTGLFSLLACASGPHTVVTAFEPVPTTADILRSNVALNRWERRIAVQQRAVTDRVGTAVFHVPQGITPDTASLGETGWLGIPGKTIEVTTTTIDAAVGPEVQVDCIKIDVEGHEDEVLRGASRILGTCRPFIIVECNPEGPYRAVERLLVEYSYDIFHLRLDGIKQVECIVPDSRDDPLRGRNFLGCPSERELPRLPQ